MERTEVIQIRVEPKAKAGYMAKAKRIGADLSDIIRKLLDEWVKK